MASKLIQSASLKYTITDAGLTGGNSAGGIAPWPTHPGGMPYERLEVVVVGFDMHMRTGDSNLIPADVLRFEDVGDVGADTFFLNFDIIDDVRRTDEGTHTHFCCRTPTGETADLYINPGARG